MPKRNERDSRSQMSIFEEMKGAFNDSFSLHPVRIRSKQSPCIGLLLTAPKPIGLSQTEFAYFDQPVEIYIEAGESPTGPTEVIKIFSNGAMQKLWSNGKTRYRGFYDNYRFESAQTMQLGQPLNNVKVEILDEHGKHVETQDINLTHDPVKGLLIVYPFLDYPQSHEEVKGLPEEFDKIYESTPYPQQ